MIESGSDVLIAPPAAKGVPVPIALLLEGEVSGALEALGPQAARAADAAGFAGRSGELLVLAGPDGGPGRVLFGLGRTAPPAPVYRSLPARLSPGDYVVEAPADRGEEAALGFALGSYRFERYKSAGGRARPRLVAPASREEALRIAAACAQVRDLVNTPANDLGPAEIEAAAREFAAWAQAAITVTAGEALLSENYPAVHAVGRAAAAHRAPRMIEISWTGPGASTGAPRLVIVGKGVAFDTGGLDLKPSSGMRWMKKDMGGAAHALGLARLIVGDALPVRLTVLIPAVENAVSADAMRPGDVLATRAGPTVEVGNTDAEGRLILADALARAGELDPVLTIDLATLTGAARVALGPDVVPFYTDDDSFAEDLCAASARTGEFVWRLPLHDGYEASLDSDVADLKNDADAWAQAGSVTAALFLRRFAPKSGVWTHLDIFSWNARSRPGWPTGAEAQALRTLSAVIRRRFG